MANRTFTLSQARELLPVVESLLRGIQEKKRRVEEIDQKFQEVNSRILLHGGLLLDIAPFAQLRAERERLAEGIKDAVSEIGAMGVQIKDLDTGLLDFPCMVDGEVILLCWKMGEETITHWHNTKEGFAGRKAIDARIANAGRRGRGRSIH
ncbi:MAG TPA: DUF2203 domain-containing protein [Terriglobales bacterium]|nr:DUF2203 domain-containing protein [Terriglobales bacterium]